MVNRRLISPHALGLRGCLVFTLQTCASAFFASVPALHSSRCLAAQCLSSDARRQLLFSPPAGPRTRATGMQGTFVRMGLAAETDTSVVHKTPMTVWIEDTDAYQVVFNVNYHKYFERARADTLGHELVRTLRAEGSTLTMVHVSELRIRSSGKLGQNLEIATKIIGKVGESHLVWEQGLYNGEELLANTVVTTRFTSTIDLTDSKDLLKDSRLSELKILQDLQEFDPEKYTPLLDESRATKGKIVANDDMVWHDEIVMGDKLSDLSIYKYFERNRNVVLGGANKLKELQESGTLIVLTSFNDFRKDLALCQSVQPGDKIISRCSAELKKFRWSFVQEVWKQNELGELDTKPFASSLATCFAIDAKTGKPVTPPEWIKACTEV